MTKSFEDYAKEAEARAEEVARLGLTTYDEIQSITPARSCWASDYRERDTGTWREAEAYHETRARKEGRLAISAYRNLVDGFLHLLGVNVERQGDAVVAVVREADRTNRGRRPGCAPTNDRDGLSPLRSPANSRWRSSLSSLPRGRYG